MTASKSKKRKRRKWLMPQEVEVWYVLPAIRRELALMMISKGRPQKQIAKMLGVTEPAVTQYKLKKSKRSRGDQIQVPKDIIPEVEKAALIIMESWENKEDVSDVYEVMTREINRLIEVLRDAGVLCEIHKEHCTHVKENCKACKDE